MCDLNPQLNLGIHKGNLPMTTRTLATGPSNSRVHLPGGSVTALARKPMKMNHHPLAPGPRRTSPAGDANVRLRRVRWKRSTRIAMALLLISVLWCPFPCDKHSTKPTSSSRRLPGDWQDASSEELSRIPEERHAICSTLSVAAITADAVMERLSVIQHVRNRAS